ncbi:MAG: anhydro-N-acetylmuramic acid kinase [Flavobacteriaceae bacterium]|nr:anhydro-N-acetylmuramic acid kinase [Flavobacteriaceae bacterium]
MKILGVMSGTSLDGIDLALVNLKEVNKIHQFQIEQAVTVPYTDFWKKRLQEGFYLSGEALIQLDADYGNLLAETAQGFIVQHQLEVDLIASHGHTIFHQPEKGYTLQIGNGPQIATKLGIPVVCDFRPQDVALGGQGAPLVPIGDQLLFGDYDYCLNLGGFANISFEQGGKRIAYDISPANIVLNPLVAALGKPYDDKGALAATGSLIPDLYAELNSLAFYQNRGSKSLGYEFVVQEVQPILKKYQATTKDMLRTLVEHMAYQIGNVVTGTVNNKMLVTGGGAYNDFLIERIAAHTEVEVVLPRPEVIDFKEALIFALLGKLRIQGKVNCLASVTGAKKNHSSGVEYF